MCVQRLQCYVLSMSLKFSRFKMEVFPFTSSLMRFQTITVERTVETIKQYEPILKQIIVRVRFKYEM